MKRLCFVKPFDSTFILYILKHLYNMIFMFKPKCSFENRRKSPLFRIAFDKINDVQIRVMKVLSLERINHMLFFCSARAENIQ